MTKQLTLKASGRIFWIQIFSATLFLMGLFGCAPSNYYLNGEYGKKEFREAAIAYLPLLPSEVQVDAHDEFKKTFGSMSEAEGQVQLARAFNEKFLKDAKSELKNLVEMDADSVANPARLIETEQVVNKGSDSQKVLNLKIPRKEFVDSLKPSIRFVIIPRSATFAYTKGKMDYTPGSETAIPNIKPSALYTGAANAIIGIVPLGEDANEIGLTLNYIIWDYQVDKPVAYGIYQAGISARHYFTQEEWLAMMTKASEILLWRSPLEFTSYGKLEEPSHPKGHR